MDMQNANKIAILINKIHKCKEFLASLENRGYPDEFEIYYRKGYTCNLEMPALDLLIDYYKNEQEKAEQELKLL
jgi:hypothetical protein